MKPPGRRCPGHSNHQAVQKRTALLHCGMPDPKIAPPSSWGRSTVATACPLDCPDSCSLSVEVERGKVTKIDGSRVAPSTDGFICGKVRQFDRRIYSEQRILHPAVRSGPKGAGQFTRVTWDEALDLVVQKM